MKLIHFFLGLVLLMFAGAYLIATVGAIDSSSSSYWPSVIGGGIGLTFGTSLLGILAWLPIRFIRGAARAPDPRRFTLYGAWILFAAYCVVRIISPQPNQELIDFVSGFQKTCVPRAKIQLTNAGIIATEQQIGQICACNGEKTYQHASKEELIEANKNKKFPDSLTSRLLPHYAKCLTMYLPDHVLK